MLDGLPSEAPPASSNWYMLSHWRFRRVRGPFHDRCNRGSERCGGLATHHIRIARFMLAHLAVYAAF